jgi:2-dehydropantoate 2-reductase
MTKKSYTPKKFAVVGAGPVGCIVAAFLAKGGYDVTLCDVIPALLEPALNPGIIVEGSDNFQAGVSRITTRVDDLVTHPPDVVIVTVKATALPLIASALDGFAGEGRYVVSWQNGIDTERVLSTTLGARSVMRAVVNYGCTLLKPGHAHMAFHQRPHYLQELHPDSRVAAVGICDALTACGLDTHHTDQIRNMVWSKAVNNSSMNPICAVTGKSMFDVINDPILFNLVDSLLKEGVAVARANEFILGPDFYPDTVNYIRNAGHHKPSMLQDIEAGRRTEIDFINGKIIEYGVRVGMPTPFNTTLRSLVKALET